MLVVKRNDTRKAHLAVALCFAFLSALASAGCGQLELGRPSSIMTELASALDIVCPCHRIRPPIAGPVYPTYISHGANGLDVIARASSFHIAEDIGVYP